MENSPSRYSAYIRFARLVPALVLVLVSGVHPAGAGEPGASTCSFTGGEVVVDLMEDDSSGILSRNAVGVIMYDDEAEPPTPAPCGLATTATTSLIRIVDTSDDGSTGIILDLREGQFVNGSNPIPIRVDLAQGPLDTFGLVGESTGDFWTFGFKKGNLQKDDEAELRFLSPPDFGFGDAGGGIDTACAGGGRGTGSASQIGWVFQGGGMADKLCGGRDTDRLIGKGGVDTLKGNGGGDTVKGGADADRILGGPGSDLLFGNKGDDGLDGGPGFDGCRGGPGGDRKKRCET